MTHKHISRPASTTRIISAAVSASPALSEATIAGCRTCTSHFSTPRNPWTGGAAPGYDWLAFSRVTVAAEDRYYSAEFPADCSSGEIAWVDAWVFWLTDDEIERGKWVEAGRPVMRFDPATRTARGWFPPDPTAYKDDSVCRTWYSASIAPACLDVKVDDDCEIGRGEDLPDIGENWMQVKTGCTPASQYVLGQDWFRSCPALATDAEEAEMVCPRPCGENLRQAFSFSCPGSSAAHDAYFSQPHVRAVYRSIGP